jgi:3-methyladenine DNA glycosylase AlkD
VTAWSDEVVGRLTTAFETVRDEARAGPMVRYMRNQFPFLGLPSPARRVVQREALASLPTPAEADVLAATRSLWSLPEREYQYAACDLLARWTRLLTSPALADLEWLITHRSWWDTVDAVRPAVGALVLAEPALKAHTRRWNRASDMWLVRSSIIFQLGYRARTDAPLLFEHCANRASDTEFFIRKGIGWALREYSKVDGAAVRTFVLDHPELSGLSRREALKWLDR